MADAFAAEGYVALAADLYSGRTGGTPEQNMALVKETLADPKQIIANLDAAVKFLRARKDVSGKVAADRLVLRRRRRAEFRARRRESRRHRDVLRQPARRSREAVKHLHHELYGTFAGLDRATSGRKTCEHFVAALRGAGIKNDVHVYDDVKHGFWLYVDRDPKANLAPALDAWQRLKAYLARTLQ